MADTILSTEHPAPAAGGRKTWTILIVLVVLAGLIAVGVRYWMKREASVAATAVPAAAGPAPAVTVIHAARKEVTPTTTLTGRVQAIDKVELRARVSGYLEKRLFDEGAEVQTGQLMFLIEQAPYKAQIAQIKGTITSAQAEVQNSKLDFERQESLVRTGTAAVARLDEARGRYGKAQGELQSQQAALDQAELDLSYTEIKAPITGKVGQAAFSIGNFVQQSSGTLATIVSHDPIYTTFPVTQRQLIEMRQRAEERGVDARSVTVRLQLADGRFYDQPGVVDFVDVQFNQATDSVTARAKFPNPKRMLIDGQLVTVVIADANPTAAIVVPQAALQFDQTGYFVLTVDAQNKVKVQPVGVGQGYETDIEITTGLSEGSRVIVEGTQKVRPDQVVNAVDAKPAAPQ